MSLGRRPTRRNINAVRNAVTSASKTQDERAIAIALWNDFRWKLKTLEDPSYQSVEALIDLFITRIKQEITHPETLEKVLEQFGHMRNRISEFTTDETGLGESEPEA